MDKNIILKWCFVVTFIIIAVLLVFGALQATNGVMAVWSLAFAYQAYKSDFNIRKKADKEVG